MYHHIFPMVSAQYETSMKGLKKCLQPTAFQKRRTDKDKYRIQKKAKWMMKQMKIDIYIQGLSEKLSKICQHFNIKMAKLTLRNLLVKLSGSLQTQPDWA